MGQDLPCAKALSLWNRGCGASECGALRLRRTVSQRTVLLRSGWQADGGVAYTQHHVPSSLLV